VSQHLRADDPGFRAVAARPGLEGFLGGAVITAHYSHLRVPAYRTGPGKARQSLCGTGKRHQKGEGVPGVGRAPGETPDGARLPHFQGRGTGRCQVAPQHLPRGVRAWGTGRSATTLARI